MKTRKGLGLGKGSGYYNMLPIDSHIHSLSARGVKQKVDYSEAVIPKVGAIIPAFPNLKWKHYEPTHSDGDIWTSEDFQIELLEDDGDYEVMFQYYGSGRGGMIEFKSKTKTFHNKKKAMEHIKELKNDPSKFANAYESKGFYAKGKNQLCANTLKRGDKISTSNFKEGIVQEVHPYGYDVRVFDGNRIVGEVVVFKEDKIKKLNAKGKTLTKSDKIGINLALNNEILELYKEIVNEENKSKPDFDKMRKLNEEIDMRKELQRKVDLLAKGKKYIVTADGFAFEHSVTAKNQKEAVKIVNKVLRGELKKVQEIGGDIYVNNSVYEQEVK